MEEELSLGADNNKIRLLNKIVLTEKKIAILKYETSMPSCDLSCRDAATVFFIFLANSLFMSPVTAAIYTAKTIEERVKPLSAILR